MRPSTHAQTLFVTKPGGTSIVERATTGLPPDLLNRTADSAAGSRVALRLHILHGGLLPTARVSG